MIQDWPIVIVHADMDAFYAAIEQLDNPELRAQPILVGPPSGRGVVLTASYEARPFDVGSAMPMAQARKRCPQAIIVPPRFERYKEVSKQIMDVFADFSPRVEPLSLDEAFLDMSGAEQFFGAPEVLGQRLKAAIKEATGGLTASVGISGTKYVAKVASGFRKPNGLTIVRQQEAQRWLAPLPIASMWGAGLKTQQKLAALGLRTIGDLAARDPEELERALGQTGRRFYALSRAEDPRSIISSHSAKSIGSERTLPSDVSAASEIKFHLRKSADAVGRRLRKQGLMAGGIRVKLKCADFRLLTRQRTMTEPTNIAEQLYAVAASLLGEFSAPGPFRLIGLAAYDLVASEQSRQLRLAMGDARQQRLEATLDEIDERFGSGMVHRAGDLLRQTGIEPEVNLDFLRTDANEEGT